MFKIELPDPADPSNVIQLSVIRESRYSRAFPVPGQRCAHTHVEVDTSLAELLCRDCKQKLNPVEYIASLAEEWQRVRHLYAQYQQAAAAYKGKSRCRCEHCNRLTRVKPMTPAEVRRFEERKET